MSIKNQHKAMRSGSFPCQICQEKAPLQRHHLRGREIKDYNKDWNVCYTCATCHEKIHLGIIIVEKWVKTSEGRTLIWRDKNSESVTDESCDCHIIP